MAERSEAQRLADAIDNCGLIVNDELRDKVADELRRLHAVNEHLLKALELVMADVKTTPNAYEEQRQAIAALRTAIEQAEKQKPMVVSQECAERGCAAHDDRVDGPGVMVGREWVGLTLEQKQHLNEVLNLQGRFPIIDAIEAMLKEKNT